jgi:3-hydroxybutyryl-CoA dehydrogenase
MLAIETVAIMGVTETGTACAVLASLAGCAVRLHADDVAALGPAFEAVRRRVELGIAAGTLTRGERQRILDGVLFTADLDEAVTGADLVVDAGPDEAEGQAARLSRLLGVTRASTPLAAAGRAAPGEVAARVAQPSRVVVVRLCDVHGPVPRLDVVASPATALHALVRAEAFALRVNRAARTVLAPALALAAGR